MLYDYLATNVCRHRSARLKIVSKSLNRLAQFAYLKQNTQYNIKKLYRAVSCLEVRFTRRIELFKDQRHSKMKLMTYVASVTAALL